MQALRYTPFGNGMRNCVGAFPAALQTMLKTETSFHTFQF